MIWMGSSMSHRNESLIGSVFLYKHYTTPMSWLDPIISHYKPKINLIVPRLVIPLLLYPRSPKLSIYFPPSTRRRQDQTILVLKIDKWICPVKILDYYQQTALSSGRLSSLDIGPLHIFCNRCESWKFWFWDFHFIFLKNWSKKCKNSKFRFEVISKKWSDFMPKVKF